MRGDSEPTPSPTPSNDVSINAVDPDLSIPQWPNGPGLRPQDLKGAGILELKIIITIQLKQCNSTGVNNGEVLI